MYMIPLLVALLTFIISSFPPLCLFRFHYLCSYVVCNALEFMHSFVNWLTIQYLTGIFPSFSNPVWYSTAVLLFFSSLIIVSVWCHIKLHFNIVQRNACTLSCRNLAVVSLTSQCAMRFSTCAFSLASWASFASSPIDARYFKSPIRLFSFCSRLRRRLISSSNTRFESWSNSATATRWRERTGSSNRPWLSRQTCPVGSGVTRNSVAPAHIFKWSPPSLDRVPQLHPMFQSILPSPPLCDFVARYDRLCSIWRGHQLAGGPPGPPGKCQAARRLSPTLHVALLWPTVSQLLFFMVKQNCPLFGFSQGLGRVMGP